MNDVLWIVLNNSAGQRSEGTQKPPRNCSGYLTRRSLHSSAVYAGTTKTPQT